MNLDPPTASIVFLFTDIEGSTRLWEEQPAAMPLALARHDTLLRQAIEANDGRVFKTVGDAFCAAFASPPQAIQAALAGQRAIQAEAWGQTPVRVRMALHAGPADERDGDYIGPAINRLGRLVSAGHGGQILISSAVQAELSAPLPAGVSLRDLGERRLKDLVRPERIFQLITPDLPADFPPLNTLDAFRTNLPVQLTSFIGRETEMAELKRLLLTNRLVTLTGPGGTGKTRLSLQAAADLLDASPDGLWFIELAPLADPDLVPQVVANTLGLREEADRPILTTLTDFLRPRTALLILDNCEHLIAASAQVVASLLHSCPQLRLLASSREALGIAGETAYYIPSLSTPNGHQQPAAQTLAGYESVRLFVERAQAVLSTFNLTDQNAPAVAQVCRQLDGIPLAIELAAARVKLLPVEHIAARLDDRFRLLTGSKLTGSNGTALPHQQTLRALIDWSYDLLAEPERALLRRLSVFAGGWTLEAAEAVCADDEPDTISFYDVLDLLTQLVNKSLVVVERVLGEETRYRLLETIRQYAREKLLAAGEGDAVPARHLGYFRQLAGQAEPELAGPRQVTWLNQLEAELDNFRAALEYSLENHIETGVLLTTTLLRFWDERGYIRDGDEWLERLLARPEASLPVSLRAKALTTQGYFALWEGEYGRAFGRAGEGLALGRQVEDRRGIAFSLFVQGIAMFLQDDVTQGQALLLESLALFRQLKDKLGTAEVLDWLGGSLADNQQLLLARPYLEESLALFRELNHLAGIVSSLTNLATIALRQEDYISARPWLEEALASQQSLGERGIVFPLIGLGQLALQQGDYDQAQAYFEAGLSVSKETGNQLFGLWALPRLGYVALHQGDLTRARTVFAESQQLFVEAGSKIGVVYALEGLANLAVIENQWQRAARLLAWANTVRDAISSARPSLEQTDIDRHLALIHHHLDPAALATAQATGRAMTMEQAIADALAC